MKPFKEIYPTDQVKWGRIIWSFYLCLPNGLHVVLLSLCGPYIFAFGTLGKFAHALSSGVLEGVILCNRIVLGGKVIGMKCVLMPATLFHCRETTLVIYFLSFVGMVVYTFSLPHANHIAYMYVVFAALG